MKALLQADGGRSVALLSEQDGASVTGDDAVSVAASGTYFFENLPEMDSRASGSDFNAPQKDAGRSVTATIRMGLALLHLDVQRSQSAVSSSFFLYSKSDFAFVDPLSEEYIRELHAR